ncbi:hypothetical protein DSO57_1032826 [Entomophthora muscae]|uniref:Uncharacterized protein n=1 Tax=Entomophthora muscae TaxID=34485 RepID=A0ACC2UA82_9FUNG|nr:hypothetical protein DSO57_1032826 [Entomophthora muscae]
METQLEKTIITEPSPARTPPETPSANTIPAMNETEESKVEIQLEETTITDPSPALIPPKAPSVDSIPAMYVKEMPGNCPSGGSHDFEDKPTLCAILFCSSPKVKCRKCQIIQD